MWVVGEWVSPGRVEWFNSTFPGTQNYQLWAWVQVQLQQLGEKEKPKNKRSYMSKEEENWCHGSQASFQLGKKRLCQAGWKLGICDGIPLMKKNWKTGAELCQAQEKLGLANKLILMFTIEQIEVVFHFSKNRVIFYLPYNLGRISFTLKLGSSTVFKKKMRTSTIF